MPRIYEDLKDDSPGRLQVDHHSSSTIQISYSPSPSRATLWNRVHPSSPPGGLPLPDAVPLLRADLSDGTITITPINTSPLHQHFLRPKYGQVEHVTLAFPVRRLFEGAPPTEEVIEDVLLTLPSGFIRDYDYGLGLLPTHRCIINAIESLTPCTELLITRTPLVFADAEPHVFPLAYEDYLDLHRAINRISRTSQVAARAVKKGLAENHVASTLGLPEQPVASGRSKLRQKLTRMILKEDEPPSRADEDNLVALMKASATSIATSRPEKLLPLTGEIELAALDSLIDHYEEMLGANLGESKWQAFFKPNVFLLNLAFGFPVITVNSQASVGGHTWSGSGEKVTDFVAKNSMTNNAALIEIKKPHTALLKLKPYRGGVYAPSAELTGPMSQALDQKYRFDQEIAQRKQNSGIHDIESCSSECCLIIGTTPEGDDQSRAFEIYRGNSRAVAIVTFDELLEKLRILRDFLRSS